MKAECHHLLKSTWKNSLTQIYIYTNSVYGPVYPIALISVNYGTISSTPPPPQHHPTHSHGHHQLFKPVSW